MQALQDYLLELTDRSEVCHCSEMLRFLNADEHNTAIKHAIQEDTRRALSTNAQTQETRAKLQAREQENSDLHAEIDCLQREAEAMQARCERFTTPSHSESMSFEDNLQLALAPTASEQLPRELHLGHNACIWKNGILEWKEVVVRGHKTLQVIPGFRKLRAGELRRLMRRLQAAPQHHVILLNLTEHYIGGDMMRELAEPIAALKALQVLVLACISTHPPPPACISHAAGNHIGDSGCTALARALPHLLALQVLNIEGSCFLTFCVMFCSVMLQGFSHAAGNSLLDDCSL
jgi:hypothetical protein